MTSEIDEFRASLVAAVQAELERHAAAVVAEVDRLREQTRTERDELRSEFTHHLEQIVKVLDQNRAESREQATTVDQVASAAAKFDTRLNEAEQRQTRRLDEMTASLEGLVAEAARPLVTDLREEFDRVNRRVEGLDTNLRRFDEQAARMVTYFNDVTQKMEERQGALAASLENDVTVKVDELKRLVDENDSTVRKFQSEVGQSVTQKMNDAEDRFNNRLLAAESRIKEEAGKQVAEIDLHVSRVSTNLDESLGVINDRIGGIDERFDAANERIDDIIESVKGVNEAAIEELKEKMSSAVGEAMLVRIEMERLEKGVNERTDSLTSRLTDIEGQLQDYTMDVSTSVQLDRIEDLERAIAELDPTQFVRKGGLPDPTVAPGAPDAASGGFANESVENFPPPADAPSGPDIAAIIAAAEGRPTDQDGQD